MKTAHRVVIPEGANGDWKVEYFTVTEKDEKFDKLRAIATMSGRYAPAGTYMRLMRNRTLVMSNTPDEVRDHAYAFYKATGRVLVNGLGLGIYVQDILEKPEVKHVTVVEIAPEVLTLVGRHLKKTYGDRLELVLADALTWKPPVGQRYNTVWHDIWDDICTDNLEEMKTLHRKYGRRCDWQGSWCRGRCEMQRDRGW
jgi:hypothetical protein